MAAGAGVEEPPSSQPLFQRLSTSISDAATDLASGLRLAGALVPEGYVGRVVLVSDGRQTRGDAAAAARELAARGLVVDVLPLAGSVGPDLRLEAVELPDTAYRGETAPLTARVHADKAASATLRVYGMIVCWSARGNCAAEGRRWRFRSRLGTLGFTGTGWRSLLSIRRR